MFITGRGGNRRDGAQWAEGLFLVLCQPDKYGSGSPLPIRAFIVWAHLEQLGAFMMGRCTVAGHKLSLSGAYGHDGLPMDVPKEVWEQATDLPPELYEAWNLGGGHNGVGSEAEAMRTWALSGKVPKLATRKVWRLLTEGQNA